MATHSDRVFMQYPTDMRAAGYEIHENDPFVTQIPAVFCTREQSPIASRIRLMWHEMREYVIARFPTAPGLPKNTKAYLKYVENVYVTDAYHSLSIEGYRVSRELIEKVRQGNWSPDDIESDREQCNAMAARGYWQAYQTVRDSISSVLSNNNAGDVVNDNHSAWYREMFAPSVTAGILKPADLAGYRNSPVFIRRSKHVPPCKEAVRDAMPVLFDCLREESEPCVRVVLGHFIFVYIHHL